MSRSYRKPYGTWCSWKGSAAKDKEFASRAMRRLQNKAVKEFEGEWDDFLLPARYEASGNDVWGWTRDGRQRLQSEPKIENYLKRCDGYYGFNRYSEYTVEEAHQDFRDALERYKDLMRK